MIRAKTLPVPLGEIAKGVKAPTDVLRRALRQLENNGLLERTGNAFALTATGQHEARRLVRSHRLWEAYLQHVGTPATEIHPSAHRLEHVYDEDAVDYLDDKLGHPLLDPHGEAIPEDFVHLVPGAEVRASLLRAGHTATVLAAGPQLQGTSLVPGEQITAGQRAEEGRIWTFQTSSGNTVRLNHQQADSVVVRLEPAAQTVDRHSP